MAALPVVRATDVDRLARRTSDRADGNFLYLALWGAALREAACGGDAAGVVAPADFEVLPAGVLVLRAVEQREAVRALDHLGQPLAFAEFLTSAEDQRMMDHRHDELDDPPAHREELAGDLRYYGRALAGLGDVAGARRVWEPASRCPDSTNTADPTHFPRITVWCSTFAECGFRSHGRTAGRAGSSAIGERNDDPGSSLLLGAGRGGPAEGNVHPHPA